MVIEYPVHEMLFADDADEVLRRHIAMGIEAAAAQSRSRDRERPEQLSILLVGYSGALNTGADLRTIEIVRQIRSVLGMQNVRIGVVALSERVPRELVNVELELMAGSYLPAFLDDACDRYDIIIVSEGSLFTSTFSDTLAIMLAGSLGHAIARGKPAIAYGVEADRMSEPVEAFVRATCGAAMIFARNERSRQRLAQIGLTAQPGADTAWTFDPAPQTDPSELLRCAGWDGARPVLTLCPINPFWWPVRPDPQRAMILQLEGRRDDGQYGGYAFHAETAGSRERFRAYIAAIAGAVRRQAAGTPAFPVVIGMEPLDREACELLVQDLGGTTPVFMAGEHDAATLAGLLRRSACIVSSRFHAILIALAAGIPAIGVSMDQRIAALMSDIEDGWMTLSVDDLGLDEALERRLAETTRRGERIAAGSRAILVRELRKQAAMGSALRSCVARAYPTFPLPPEPKEWWDYLPPLSLRLADLIGARTGENR